MDKGNIPELPQSVNCIDISLCEMSYAELPKMYSYVMGVTGTLQDLSEHKREIMRKEYNIKD